MRVECFNNISDTMATKDTMSECTMFSESIYLVFAKLLDGLPSICTAEHGIDGKKHNIDRIISFIDVTARIFYCFKMVDDTHTSPLFYVIGDLIMKSQFS